MRAAVIIPTFFGGIHPRATTRRTALLRLLRSETGVGEFGRAATKPTAPVRLQRFASFYERVLVEEGKTWVRKG